MADGDRDLCRTQRHVGGLPGGADNLPSCAECRTKAEESLVELPRLYDMCAYVLDARPPRPVERVSGSRPRGIVLRDEVVDIRSDILGVLASWCGLVTSERGVAGPDELSVASLSTFVQVHFEWLAAHPAGADFVDELTALADRAGEVLATEPAPESRLGPCPRPGCGWALRADGHPPTRIRCGAGHEWPPAQWLLLLRDGRRDSTMEGGE
jgi:hypothetical protein